MTNDELAKGVAALRDAGIRDGHIAAVTPFWKDLEAGEFMAIVTKLHRLDPNAPDGDPTMRATAAKWVEGFTANRRPSQPATPAGAMHDFPRTPVLPPQQPAPGPPSIGDVFTRHFAEQEKVPPILRGGAWKRFPGGKA
jgi:hypothetical protein